MFSEPDQTTDAIVKMLDGLTPSQREGATTTGAILVLAGAGTGKTKTLTSAIAHRIACQGVRPQEILAVTFTNKAAHEMKVRIQRMLGEQSAPNWVGTFHSLSARMLRMNPDLAGLRPKFDVLDAEDSRRVLKRVMLGMGIDLGEGSSSRKQDSPLRSAESHIGWCKDNLVTPEEAPQVFAERIKKSSKLLDADALREAALVYVQYQAQLRTINAADFGDLLLWTTLAMARDESYCQSWSQRFSCVFGDEYQDVNYAQYVWLRQFASSHGQIFIVGDDDQAIFGWRGSDVKYIRRFTKDFPDANVVKLEQNFRSTSHILDGANAVIARDSNRLGKNLYTELGEGEKIEVVGFRDAESEAQGIVMEMVRRHAQGIKWGDMAILYRANALSRLFEAEMRQNRVPYALVGDISFWQREEVKDSLALLRLVENWDNHQSDEALRRVVNTPTRGIGDKALEAIEQTARTNATPLFAALATAPLSKKAHKGAVLFSKAILSVAETPNLTLADTLSLVVTRTGYIEMLRESRSEDANSRLRNIEELITAAEGFDSATDLLEAATLGNAKDEEEQEGGAVQMMSFHRAKGLEFPHVFLPAWESGLFPDYRVVDVSEERRLAYVALTRAMRRATVTYAGYRRKGQATPSSFIQDIPQEDKVYGWIRDSSKTSVRPKATFHDLTRERFESD